MSLQNLRTTISHGCGPLPMSGVEREYRANLSAEYSRLIGVDPFEDDPTIEPREVEKILREYRSEQGIVPNFAHSPMIGRYSMLAYTPGDQIGREYNFSASSDACARSNAAFETGYLKSTHVRVRSPDGTMIHDGPIAGLPQAQGWA